LKNGSTIKGQAEITWNLHKDAGDELLNQDVPDANNLAEVLLMYLQVRYTFFMLLGRPAKETSMRAQLENFKMHGTTAAARDAEGLRHIALFVRKKESTPEGWCQEASTMTSKTQVGKQFWVSFTERRRAQRETQINAGVPVRPVTYVDIKNFMGLVKEKDQDIEGITRTSRSHSLRAGKGDQEDEEWLRAIDQMQRQQQQQQDDYEQQQRQQTDMFYAQLDQAHRPGSDTTSTGANHHPTSRSWPTGGPYGRCSAVVVRTTKNLPMRGAFNETCRQMAHPQPSGLSGTGGILNT
jgi:hypothetical protein